MTNKTTNKIIEKTLEPSKIYTRLYFFIKSKSNKIFNL